MMEVRLVFLDLRTTPPRPMDAPASSASIYCLGNFDGVHLAHQAILREGVRASRERLAGSLCGVFCFFRPSADFRPAPTVPAPSALQPEGTHLTTLREKLSLCAGLGVDFACLCDFRQIRSLSPAAFCDLLVHHCGCRGVVCGFNYRFGAGGNGTPEDLRAVFDAPGFSGVTVWPEMTVDGLTVSSSHIRQALIAGDMDTVTRLLGHPYALESRVVHGKHLGHTLGFPTANQFFPAERLIPAHGVYAALAHTEQGVFPAVSNIGVRPTVDGGTLPRVNCETYLIGFDGDLYGQTVRVEFLSHLRGEERFDSLEALRAAISADANTACEVVHRMRRNGS